jgi:tRNA (cytidine32/uridine32-2'-O)-methyltransferase
MAEQIRIILVSPSHPGNIGATARAMKTMGLSELCLVNPCEDFPSQTATAMAAGADDILKNAQICDNLDHALADCQLIIGTSARLRHLAVQMLDPEQCATLATDTAQTAKVAIMFGREHAGLTNEELNRCHYHVHIPSVENFSSLNLAAAVQLICYEIRKASLTPNTTATAITEQEPLATDHQVQLYFQSLEQLLTDIRFIKNSSPQKIMHRLRRLYNRTHIEKTEIDLLLGILTTINKNLK